MKRRNFLGAAAAAVATPQDRHPHVVILLADDLGWADVGFHSSEISTPNIDNLAREGVQIERFYACPLCSPTRASLMTGRYPIRYGIQYTVVRPWEPGLPLAEHTIAESFRAAGYETAMAGKWHLGHADRRYLPGSRGFDHSYGHLNGEIDYNTHMREGGLDWHRDGTTLEEPGYTTDLIGAEAVARIEKRNRQKPLFLYVPFNAPHAPLQAPTALIDKYAFIADPKRRTYAAMVDALDTQIGRILDTLEHQGMANDTIVMFLSDNGGPTPFGARNAPLRGAKGSTWEGGMRVPAILRWPGHLSAGLRMDQVMAAIDVFPTLAAAAGIKPQNKLPLDGRSLWPALMSKRAVDRGELFFAVDSAEKTHYAVFHGPWKLVRETARDGSGAQSWLFRIAEDPLEQHDAAAANQNVVNDLTAKIDAWRSLHPANGLRHTSAPPPGWHAPKRWADEAR